MCEARPAVVAHHDPPWHERQKHNPNQAAGLCKECHKRTLSRVAELEGEPGELKGSRRVRTSG
jgi:hypothetical protein